MRRRDVIGGGVRDVEAGGVFVAIGHAPATKLLRGQLARGDRGTIRTHDRSTATDIPGVFAAGDVADPTYRQAVTAAGTGAMAALDVVRWLAAEAYRAVDFHETLGAIQQSGTIATDAGGVVLDVRRATLPFQVFDERALLALLALLEGAHSTSNAPMLGGSA